MKKFTILILLAMATGCMKEKSTGFYMDCFKGKTSSPVKSFIGCGTMLVAVNLDDHKLVEIMLNEDALSLKTKCLTFRLEDDTNNIKLKYFTYANHPDSIYFNYCNDVAFPDSSFGTKVTWKAVSGIITVVVSKEKKDRIECEGYRTAIELDNVRFLRENSTQDTVLAKLTIVDKFLPACIP